MKRAAVLGAGAWGTALAKLLSDKGDGVRLYTRRPELSALIARTHENGRYLPGIPLAPGLVVTDDLEHPRVCISARSEIHFPRG